MMGFLNASMSGATSRFMTFELGCGSLQRQQNVFSSAMTIHIGVALIVFLISETIGLWFVKNKLVIPEERIFAANVVYQLSIFSTLVSITQVPYSACITSHEKFDIYAIFSILEVSLRLLVVYLLVISDWDKLILYSVLMASVSVLIMCMNRLYCRVKFAEARFQFIWKKEILLPMLNFSGWDMFGNLSVIGRTSGVNILLNIFFGPVLNAASGIATQVQNAVMGIANNLVTASRPQIVKQYAVGQFEAMFEIMSMAIKLSFILLAIISVPIILDADFVLHLWLGEVPQNAAIFCAFTLLFNFFANMSSLLGAIIHATGRMKRISIINGSLYLSVLPVTYMSFKLGLPAYFPYLYNVLSITLGMFSNAWTVKKYIPLFDFKKFLNNVYLRCLLILLFDMLFSWAMFKDLHYGWGRFIARTFFSTLFLCTIGYLLLLDDSQKNLIKIFVNTKLCNYGK